MRRLLRIALHLLGLHTNSLLSRVLLEEASFERIHESLAVQVIDDQLCVFFIHTPVFNEVLYFHEVHAHVSHLLQEFLLLLIEEFWHIFVSLSSERLLHRQLFHNLLLLFLVGGERENVSLFEIVEHLAGNFFERLLCEQDGVVFEISEWHKLHDVGLHVLLETS